MEIETKRISRPLLDGSIIYMSVPKTLSEDQCDQLLTDAIKLIDPHILEEAEVITKL